MRMRIVVMIVVMVMVLRSEVVNGVTIANVVRA